MTKPLRSQEKQLTTKDRIIVALDVSTADEARSIVRELGGEAGGFKIGLQLFVSAGPKLVAELVNAGAKVFLDLKFHDIPNTVAKASVEAARCGVWMFNVHALGGREMMTRAVFETREVCDREGLLVPMILGVTVLTSSNGSAINEVGIGGDVGSAVLNLARLSADCGLDGVVASPEEAAAVRRTVPAKDFQIITPGIRPENATNDDQKRVMTPAAALAAGSDYIVIGRPITECQDKTPYIRKLINEIDSINN